jgi:hypothetical protein
MRRLRTFRATQKRFYLHDLAVHAYERIRDLVDWLNESKGTDQYKGVESLIRLIGEVRNEMPPVTLRQWIEKEMSADSGNDRVWEKVRRINEQLSGYRMWPRYTNLRTIVKGMNTNLSVLCSKKMKSSPLKWEWWSEGDSAAKAAHQVVRLEEDGLLESLLPCPVCNKWFFAGRGWQTFCSARCRGQHYSSSPEGRAQRASYMRKYRKQEKGMDDDMKRVSALPGQNLSKWHRR